MLFSEVLRYLPQLFLGLMKNVLTFLLPWSPFVLQDKIVQGYICLMLQLSLIGWIPAFIWALVVRKRMQYELDTDLVLQTIREF